MYEYEIGANTQESVEGVTEHILNKMEERPHSLSRMPLSLLGEEHCLDGEAEDSGREEMGVGISCHVILLWGPMRPARAMQLEACFLFFHPRSKSRTVIPDIFTIPPPPARPHQLGHIIKAACRISRQIITWDSVFETSQTQGSARPWSCANTFAFFVDCIQEPHSHQNLLSVECLGNSTTMADLITQGALQVS